ncbi:MAG TPA: glycosyltransferase, partial [Streptosporangiaceae bacterium]|nr:glycosyltransferase [Streptosporangiaceae bacterium]
MLVCAVTGMCLVLTGYTHGALARPPAQAGGSPAGAARAPASVRHGSPLVVAGNRRPYSLDIPSRTIALTFDDGPDPRWTPRILAVLRRFGAHATFFQTGARTAAHPALVRKVLADGNEVGTGTYTHADLGAAGWRRSLELTLSQNALAGTAGMRTRLLRPPFWPSQRTLDAAEWRAIRQAGQEGYLVAFTGRQTRDWARPGAAAIVARAMPHGHRGEIVTMQDGGPSGGQTLAALTRLLTRLRGKGYRFTTITGGLRLPAADVPATGGQRVAGDALVLAQRISADVVAALGALLVLAAVLAVIRLVALAGYAWAHRRRLRRVRSGAIGAGHPPFTGPISVVVPAYNEAAGIAATVMSVCDAHYLNEIEVIVVDDGSTDRTAGIAHALGIPGVRVVSQPNSGKAVALNTGIALARHEIVVL